MAFTRRRLLGTGLAAGALAMSHIPGFAQADDTIRIGVLTDFSGPYSDLTGSVSVSCVEQAVAEFTAATPGIKVEILTADHLNKTDVGASIAREWIDRQGVDVITNIGNSAVALACKSVVEEKDKALLVTGASVASLTGDQCSANLVHWTFDTWNMAHATATSVTRDMGGNKWFFVAPDYAAGRASVENTTAIIKANGGDVVGGAFFPFPGTTDFAAFLLQAQSSGANVVAFSGAGADFVNFVKQARSFGVMREGVRVVGMAGLVTDIVGMGLPLAHGVTAAENFYWDLNDRTRAWYERVKPRLKDGVLPNMIHAGDYSAIVHYLKAVKEIGVAPAKKSGRDVIAAMKAMPTDDDCFGSGSIRADGRKIHPSYLFEAKSPEESSGPADIYKQLATIPADQAFRPIADGNCPLVKS